MAQNTPNPLFEQGTEWTSTPSENPAIQTVTKDTKWRIAKLSATVWAVILAWSMNAQAWKYDDVCDLDNNWTINWYKEVVCVSDKEYEESRRNIEESRRNIEESRRNTEESRKKSEEYRRETEKLKQILDMLWDN
jgi:hypothetical protein